MSHRESITGVAILDGQGALWSLPKPNRHHNIFALAAFIGRSAEGGTQGFTTSLGRFVNRSEALAIAGRANQILEHKNGDLTELYSEDLW